MSTDLEGQLRQRMEHATAQIQVPRGLARRAARHRRRRIVIRAGIVVAARPSAPAVLTAKLLADRASAAALTQPAVSPGQWVYRVVESHRPHTPKGVPDTGTEAGWETADGGVTYGNNYSVGVDVGDNIPSYSELGSLPASPAALDAYLARLVYPDSNPTQVQQGLAAFSVIEDMLINYVLPPTLEAEIYQALAAIPAVTVDSHVTAIDGQAGVAFVLPPTPQSEKLEIILDASDYRFLAMASWDGDSSFQETAVVQMVIVGAPGSTQPSLTPPTAAELLAEHADRAVTFTNTPSLIVQPSTWVLRDLATSSGHQTVWATADDSEQASFVNGTLQVCSRSAACATSTQWLMPAGPSYTLVNPPIPQGRPPFKHLPPSLPDSLPQLLATLNTYATGCTDVAGDCNAVNAMANIIAGYANRGGPQGDWFLMLADIPGVTVQQVTDVTGQADVAFRFPFTDGITEILFNASTYQFAGYVRGGIETVITKEVTVSGPGSLTPVVVHPKSAPMLPAGR
ncbi:MAG TPA: hypothetical protein VGS06_19950 [Streptosporangiaceae bacterium]|nr:hypothetical protein [Streptosporangiaceae bacterium]